jgi:tripartite-type tricarboxylate transporter receptor subunit TctC
MSTPIFQLTTAKYAHNVSFDENTFKAISGVASAPFVITVNESFPGKTLADFIAYVKANPGKLSFGSAGAGSTTHVAAVMVLKAAGLDMVHVPYRGVAPALRTCLRAMS